MGHVMVSAHRGKPIRVRATYDPFAPFNLISRQILSPVDMNIRGGPLPTGFGPTILDRREVYMQVPWRCHEFSICSQYIRLDVQIQRGRWTDMIPFMVNDEDQTSVVFGKGFCRRFFYRLKDEETLLLRDPVRHEFVYEIMSSERPELGREHVYTEQELHQYVIDNSPEPQPEPDEPEEPQAE